jgi:3D (Asp-Asp-Asp) domain-containing protein
MKGLLVAVLLAAMVSPSSAALFGRQKHQTVLARVTVYWASGGKGSDRYTRRHKCATGLRLKAGHCAVDPARIPYGSSVILPDGTTLAAVDTGTAVKNRKAARVLGRTPTEKNAVVIDRFFETKSQALAWAATHPHFVAVRVIAPQKAVAVRHGKAWAPFSHRHKGVTVASVNGSRGGPELPKIR